MKKTIIFLVSVIFVAACNVKPNVQGKTEKPNIENQKVLVAYFSATGTTKKVAQNLARVANADIYEINPLVSYTSADLNWRDQNSRTSVEMHDENARPAIVTDNFSVKDYDTIYLGFPIWWGTAPRVVKTFLESQDFSNKKLIIFATSGSSGLGKTDEDLKPSISPSATIIKGRILNDNPSVEELDSWLKTLK